jgi:hypothetical protein
MFMFKQLRRCIDMIKYKVIVLLFIVALWGCTQQIRVDAENYIKNQAMYEGKPTIISVEIKDILENYALFEGKDLEIMALVAHYEKRDSPGWYLTFEKDGEKIRGYEDDYQRFVPRDAVYLARWAKKEGGTVTARGKLMQWGIELDHLSYKSLTVNTNSPWA